MALLLALMIADVVLLLWLWEALAAVCLLPVTTTALLAAACPPEDPVLWVVPWAPAVL